jgi:hypothetical protein
MLRGKMSPKLAIFGHKIPKQDLNTVKAIYEKVESRPERYELNLYVSGEDEDDDTLAAVGASDNDEAPSAAPEASA